VLMVLVQVIVCYVEVGLGSYSEGMECVTDENQESDPRHTQDLRDKVENSQYSDVDKSTQHPTHNEI
jgi:hypothetical protein